MRNSASRFGTINLREINLREKSIMYIPLKILSADDNFIDLATLLQRTRGLWSCLPVKVIKLNKLVLQLVKFSCILFLYLIFYSFRHFDWCVYYYNLNRNDNFYGTKIYHKRSWLSFIYQTLINTWWEVYLKGTHFKVIPKEKVFLLFVWLEPKTWLELSKPGRTQFRGGTSTGSEVFPF